MKIPFVDLKKQYLSLKKEIDLSIQNVINETAFIKGKYVDEFEKSYANEYGVRHCISVANGTDAIFITLKMLGVRSGDEVITVANTWISTAEAITLTGAKPVFIDIDDYYTINCDRIEEKITPKTKAIIAVHLFGQPADIDAIRDICKNNQLFLIEDCAQAHFAEYKLQRVGTFGIAGTFSFYPSKNLGAFGDAGAIITNDDELATHIRKFANHGALKKHFHDIEGMNSRMDGIQAAILSVKLPLIHHWNKKRLENAYLYNKLLDGLPDVVLPKIRSNSKHIFHLYVIRFKSRDNLKLFLKEKGIDTGIHYPTPLPFLNAYKYLNYTPQDFPIAKKFQSQIISLPMYPELTQQQIEYVCENIHLYFNK